MKQNNFTKKLFMVLAMFVTFAFLINAKVIYVDCNATGSNDGTSWEDAFTDLQDGLDDASSGDEIRVAKCTYKPSKKTNPNDDRTATFQLVSGVIMKGGFPGYNCASDSKQTVLSGDIGTPDDDSDNCYHVVTGSNTTTATILDGFVIKYGNADGTSPHCNGGGMYNNNGNPTVRDCSFIENKAQNGGGMYNYNDGKMEVSGCTFCGNEAQAGGALYNDHGNPMMLNCVIYNNSADNGGGVYNDGYKIRIKYCTFYKNEAIYYGGAAYNNGNSIPICSSVLWCDEAGSAGPEIYLNSGSANVTYSDVKGGWSGAGNIDANPDFVDPDGEDDEECTEDENLQLHSGSPCIDAGTYLCYIEDPVDNDRDGNPRFVDDCGTDDTGEGDAPIADMGAYEYREPLQYHFLKTPGKDFLGIGTCPRARLHIGDTKGVTFSDDGQNKALCWNAYYDNYTCKYLDSDFAAQVYTDYGEDRLTFKVAATGTKNHNVSWNHCYTIKPDGNIGLGTYSPQEKLHIGSSKGLTIRSAGDKYISWNAYYDSDWKYLDSDSAFQIASDYGSDKWHFKTAASGTGNSAIDWTNGLTLQAGGNVGIFTANPLERLQIGGNKGVTFHDGGDKALSWNAYFDNGWKYLANDFATQFYMDYTNHKFHLNAAATGQANGTVSWSNIFTVQADGKFGIGTVNPKEMLQIGSGKGLTIHSGTDLALSWNAYYDSGWKYLGDDYAYQLYAGSTADRLTVRTAASGTADNAVTWTDCITYLADGSVAIGTTDSQGYKLAVKGDVIAESLVVKPYEEWPDMVFQANHRLPAIAEVEQYISDNKRLPGIPSAEEVARNGVNVGEMQVKMLQKIEELTLYVIELKKENESLKKRLFALEKE